MKRAISFLFIFLSFSTFAQVGIGTTTPATTLDVNGGVTIRETEVTIASNAATIPANVSMVRLTGAATGTISIIIPPAPIAGQQLTIYNNTTGGFASILNGFNIPFNQSINFVFSNGAWQSTIPGGSTILPYASAAPAVLTTVAGGLVGTVALVGFGNSISGVGLTGSAINLSGGPGINLNYSFSMPRSGVVKSITATFSNVVALSLIGSNITITAQLYKASTGNSFSPITGASVNLSPNLTGSVTLGQTFTGIINGLSIPLSSQDRLLMVVSATASGISLINTVTGYVSAGVSFD